MRAREDGLEILARRHAELGEEDRRGRLEARVRRFGGEGHLLAANILDRLDARTRIGDDLHLVAEGAVFGGHHREGAEPGAGHGQRVRTGVEARNMQAACAHRLDLGGVRLDREELDVLAGGLGQVVQEPGPDLGIDGGVLDGGVGEDQRVGIDPFGRIGGDIGDQVAIRIGVPVTQRELSLGRQRDTQAPQQPQKSYRIFMDSPHC
jgi:hypothetical protein